LFDRRSPILWLDGRGHSKVPLDRAFNAGFCRGWSRQKIGISLLHTGNLLGRLHCSLQALLIQTIRGGSCGLPLEGNANRDHIPLFGNVLMNRVVGKARKCAASTRDDRLDIVGGRKFLNERKDIVSLVGREHGRGETVRVPKACGLIVSSTWPEVFRILLFYVDEAGSVLGARHRLKA